MSWLAFALNPFPDLFAIGPGGAAGSTAKLKIKDALLRRRHTDVRSPRCIITSRATT
jgi:hypothetical protein